jgi:hypothetical protein
MVNALTTYSAAAPSVLPGALSRRQDCVSGIDVLIGLDVALATGYMR